MTFQAFDPNAHVRKYFTTMPHWRQMGCTYFVTYRLADSIPKDVISQWEREKCQWLGKTLSEPVLPPNMGDAFARLQPNQRKAFEKHFNRQLNAYLDQGRGSCVLRNPQCSEIIVEGWRHFDTKLYELGDLVVMPNHVHVLVRPLGNH